MTPTSKPQSKYFPPALLGSPIWEKVAYFRDFIVSHPRLDQVLGQVWSGMTSPLDGTLHFVIGPTGVGKTTLREALERKLDDGKKTRPFLSVEVPPTESNIYNWDRFYTAALRAGGDKRRPLGRNLREQFLTWIQVNQPKALFVDETQHFIANGSIYRVQAQMDVLKSLANNMNTPMVLFGTYELLACRNLNAQLARRSMDIPFERYQATAGDLKDFNRVLLTFQRKLPVRALPDLLNHAEYFFAVSIGCVGILKTWLLKALRQSWVKNDGRLTIEIIQETAPCLSKCHSMAAEVIESEARWHKSTDTMERLYSLLGLNLPRFEPEPRDSPAINASLLPKLNSPSEADDNPPLPAPTPKTIKVRPELAKPIPKPKARRIPIGQPKDGSG